MPISLLFGVHAHQPVGNFPAVIDDAHVRSYGMFLRVMERYPEFRFSVHFSGWLLDVLFERFPEDMARLAAMTRRGQVEWFGSGDCEPVLAAIPHRDRVTQIATLSDKIEHRFGMRPSGAWLTERVWESSVVTSLVATGIRYVAVDDYHFLCAGESQDRLDSFFSTEPCPGHRRNPPAHPGRPPWCTGGKDSRLRQSRRHLMTAIAHVQNGPAAVPANADNLPTACALCSHNCGLRVDVKDNTIVEVRADDSHPATRGYSCNKAYAIAHYVGHGQRVTHPLKKQPDGTFQRISWDQAITEIAAKLNAIRHNHAPRAIAFAGLGGQGNHSSGLGAIPLMYGIGTPMVFTSLAQEKTQHWLNDRRMIRGTHDLYLVPDKHHAKFILLMGSNPHISNQGANPKEALKELFRDPERRLVAVDPRINETTRLADRHLRIKPSGDVFLLLALAGVIVQDGLLDHEFVSTKVQDFERLGALFARVDIARMAVQLVFDPQLFKQPENARGTRCFKMMDDDHAETLFKIA